jgi:hypothetical protein
MVTIQDAAGNWVELTSKQDIEHTIIQNNQEKFQQSFNTPFMQPPLSHLFGFCGLTSSVQAVLAGVFEPPEDTDTQVKSLLEELQMPEHVCNLGCLKLLLPLDTYRSYWKSANSKTSCNPGALSFASLKSCALDDQLSEFKCSMTRLPLLSGYAPLRWQQMIDVMILKKVHLTNLSNLCTICLFHPDCNYAFKYVGCEMMNVAEANAMLAPEKYGSRKHHQAITLAVNKVLTNDIFAN